MACLHEDALFAATLTVHAKQVLINRYSFGIMIDVDVSEYSECPKYSKFYLLPSCTLPIYISKAWVTALCRIAKLIWL